MSMITKVIILAFLVEAIWENLKMIFQNGQIQFDRVGALITGIIVAIAMNLDIFVVMGFDPVIGFIGVVFTGILISRGGNFIHDLFSKLEPPSEEFFL